MEEQKLLQNTKEEIRKIKDNLIILIEEQTNSKLDNTSKTIIFNRIDTICQLNASITLHSICKDL